MNVQLVKFVSAFVQRKLESLVNILTDSRVEVNKHEIDIRPRL